MTSQKPLEQRTSSTRAYSTTRCCTVSFSVPLRPGAAEPPAWVCTSPFPEATLCSTWRQHCNGTRPAEIPAALTWGCWQHGLNNLCWDSLGLQLKTEPRPTWTQFASHHSRNRNFFFAQTSEMSDSSEKFSRLVHPLHNQIWLPKINSIWTQTIMQREKKNHLTWWFKHKRVSQYCQVNPDTLNRIFQSWGVQPTAKNNISVVQSIQL